MSQARSAAEAAVGAFTNAAAAVAFLRRALDAGRPASILCAGSEGRVSLEDTLCAGLLVTRLADPADVPGLSDSAQIAAALYRGSADRLARSIFGARHTQRLIALGYADDVAFAARIDASDALPVFRDGPPRAGGVGRWVSGSVGQWVSGSVGQWVSEGGRPAPFAPGAGWRVVPRLSTPPRPARGPAPLILY